MVAAAFPLLTLAFCDSIAGCTDTGARAMFGGSYVVDDFALVLKGLFLVTGAIVLLLSVGYLGATATTRGSTTSWSWPRSPGRWSWPRPAT